MTEKCDECGGVKNAVNNESGEKVCNNRSCSESPMRNELTYM